MSLRLAALRHVGGRFYNALTLVDLGAPDQPLVYVNAAFRDLTGFQESEILGRNCRFLQGPGTDARDVARIRTAIDDGLAVYCDLLNYRRDGSSFYNRLVLLPLLVDERPHFIGMQVDAGPILAAELARGRSFDAIKTSETIRDRINNHLMRIATAFDHADEPSREAIVERARGDSRHRTLAPRATRPGLAL